MTGRIQQYAEPASATTNSTGHQPNGCTGRRPLRPPDLFSLTSVPLSRTVVMPYSGGTTEGDHEEPDTDGDGDPGRPAEEPPQRGGVRQAGHSRAQDVVVGGPVLIDEAVVVALREVPAVTGELDDAVDHHDAAQPLRPVGDDVAHCVVILTGEHHGVAGLQRRRHRASGHGHVIGGAAGAARYEREKNHDDGDDLYRPAKCRLHGSPPLLSVPAMRNGQQGESLLAATSCQLEVPLRS
jgi:hypothetical protein